MGAGLEAGGHGPGQSGRALFGLSEIEILWRNTELGTQAAHVVAGKPLTRRIVRQWGEGLRAVSPQIVDLRCAPRALNVDTHCSVAETMGAGTPDEFSQGWHLGERRQRSMRLAAGLRGSRQVA